MHGSPLVQARDATRRTGEVHVALREHADDIVKRWIERARAIGREHRLDRFELLDHIPYVIEAIAQFAEDLAAQRTPRPPTREATRHALDRLHDGFDLATVVSEVSMLRAAIVDALTSANVEIDVREHLLLDEAIDLVVLATIEQYTKARDRTMRGLDRISVAALESETLDLFLQRLLRVFVETTPAVDTAVILLREGEELRARAAIGIEAANMVLGIGRGFAGKIAATKKPLALENASEHPLVEHHRLRERRLRALYGVPLVDRGELLGVAYMGSQVTAIFSEQDIQLFLALAARATSALAQHLLRDDLQLAKRNAEVAHAQLDALVRASPVAIGFIDPDLRYITVNEALARMNGRPMEMHRGRTIAEILPDPIARDVAKLVRQVMETGKPIENLELEVSLPGAAPRWLLINYFPVRDSSGLLGMGAVVADVSAQKDAEHRERRISAELKAVVDAFPDAVYIGDERGFTLVNREAARAGGYASPRELLRDQPSIVAELEPRDFTTKERVGADDAPFARALRGESTSRDLILRNRATGEERIVRSAAAPILFDGKIIGAVGVHTDLSERVKIQEDLQRTLRVRDDLLAIVSHDLRNPLGTIQMNAAMLLERAGMTEADRRIRKVAQSLQRAAGTMARLIHDLVDFASIQEGRLKVTPRPEDPELVVREAVDSFITLADERRIDLRAELPANLPAVLCDRDRIFQVLANILGNALRITPERGSVTIHARETNREVVISVADTGPGLTEQELQRVFDRAWRSPTASYKGTGLGLTIAKGIVDAHAGRIWATSTPGHGATFHFSLPLAPIA